MHARQAVKKNPGKYINTDGNEIADLQETMRSDSSAVSPHLIWHQSLWGLCCSQVSGVLRQMWLSTKSCVQEVLVPLSLPLCKRCLKKYIYIYKNKNSLLDSWILKKVQIIHLFWGNLPERKCLPIIAMKTFICP